MKKTFLLLYILLFASVLVSCVTTGQFEVSDNNTLVSYKCKDIPECCEKYKFFTDVSFSSYFYDPNFLIGRTIKNNLTKPVRLEKLPAYLKTKGPILEYLPEEAKINYYIVDEIAIFLYSFTLEIDKAKLDNTSITSFNYSEAMDSAFYWERQANIAAQPVIEKSRRVPYTKYWDGEPRTKYRTEKYLAPNPDYNPMLAAKYTENYEYWQREAFKYKEQIEMDWYDLYFN